jgi:fucose permease
MHACWSLGAFAGAGAGALGVAVGLKLTPQLLILGIPTEAVTVVLTARMLPDRAEPAPEPDTAAPPQPPKRTLSVAVLLLGAIAFASMLCEGAAADWSSVYLRDSAAGSPAIAGLGYTVFALAMVVVRMTGDRLLARFGARTVIPLLASVAAVALAIALAIGAVATGLVAFFLLGLGVGAVVPTTFSAAGRLPGIHPGRSIAGVSGLGWAGFVLGPPVIGQLAAATSLPLALGLVPLLCAVIAVGTLRVTAMHG